MNARIIRELTLTDGTVLKRGDVVDVSTWRNAETLVRVRYIEILPVNDAKVEVAAPKATTRKPAAKKVAARQ